MGKRKKNRRQKNRESVERAAGPLGFSKDNLMFGDLTVNPARRFAQGLRNQPYRYGGMQNIPAPPPPRYHRGGLVNAVARVGSLTRQLNCSFNELFKAVGLIERPVEKKTSQYTERSVTWRMPVCCTEMSWLSGQTTQESLHRRASYSSTYDEEVFELKSFDIGTPTDDILEYFSRFVESPLFDVTDQDITSWGLERAMNWLAHLDIDLEGVHLRDSTSLAKFETKLACGTHELSIVKFNTRNPRHYTLMRDTAFPLVKVTDQYGDDAVLMYTFGVLDQDLAQLPVSKGRIASLAKMSLLLMLASQEFILFPLDHFGGKAQSVLFRSRVVLDEDGGLTDQVDLVAMLQPEIEYTLTPNRVTRLSEVYDYRRTGKSISVNVGTYSLHDDVTRADLAQDLLINLSALVDIEVGFRWRCPACESCIQGYDPISLDRLLLISGQACVGCQTSNSKDWARAKELYQD